MADLQAMVASRAAQMQELGITASWLMSTAGAHVVIEPMLYWSDQLDPLHMRYLSPRNRERFGSFALNPRAREMVRAMREQLRDTMDKHGAVHSQIGRFYRLSGSAVHGDLLSRLKAALDPDHRLNPGVLGLPQPEVAPPS
jgi:D-lactate dehydrogenase (cytochrome)